MFETCTTVLETARVSVPSSAATTLGNMLNTANGAGTSAVTSVPKNTRRLTLRNIGSNNIYFHKGTATTNFPYLAAGESITLYIHQTLIDQLTFIAATSATNMAVIMEG